MKKLSDLGGISDFNRELAVKVPKLLASVGLKLLGPLDERVRRAPWFSSDVVVMGGLRCAPCMDEQTGRATGDWLYCALVEPVSEPGAAYDFRFELPLWQLMPSTPAYATEVVAKVVGRQARMVLLLLGRGHVDATKSGYPAAGTSVPRAGGGILWH